jgi:hypothetical protein
MNWRRTSDGRVVGTEGTGPVGGLNAGYAQIYLDLDNVHPVFDGRWHRVRLDRLPTIGERLTTLCGHEKAVAFADAADRTAFGVPTCCYECDLVYRRQRGIEIRAGHRRSGN